MKLKMQIAIALITSVLAEKSACVGVKVFINDCKSASTEDLCVLLDRVRKGKDYLTNAFRDDLDRWHFTTAR